MSQKTVQIVWSELLQIATNFDIFWQKDGKEATIMRGALIFHLT